MKTNSNTYTILYSAVMVVIVAFLLAFVSRTLKPMQDVNVALDVKKQILYSLNIRNLTDAEAEAKFSEVVNGKQISHGEFEPELIPADPMDGKDGMYVCEIDGNKKYVIPLKGMGLWGGISGFISIDDDLNTVYGAYFNHESETAGLGAEIKDSQAWQEKFQGKKLFADDSDGTDGVALSVVKKVEDPTTQVDAVTGATLTSNGVSDMLKECIGKYIKRVVKFSLPAGTDSIDNKIDNKKE